MAKVYLHTGEWKMHAIGEIANGETFDQMIPQMLASL
jgi:tellurium resistance protein TerZ